MPSFDALATAREKLQATDVPMILRVSYYLRVSCTALEADGIGYSHLLHHLYAQSPMWLSTCKVTPEGILESSDRPINTLLKPITALHRADQAVHQPIPAAA